MTTREESEALGRMWIAGYNAGLEDAAFATETELGDPTETRARAKAIRGMKRDVGEPQDAKP